MTKKDFMEIGKNQSLYKALPGCWHHYSDPSSSSYSFSTLITWWNTKQVEGIYKEKVIREIMRKVSFFGVCNGNINDFSRSDIQQRLDLVEVKIEASADEEIRCKINPLLFYCTSCGEIKYYDDNLNYLKPPKCCGGYMAQLQFVNACSCGFAEGVKPYKSRRTKYFPKKDLRKFEILTGNNIIKKRFEDVYENSVCPVCKGKIYSYNAFNQKLFFPQCCKTVNLIDERYGDIYKKEGKNGELLIVAKYLGIISQNKYESILNSSYNFFHPEQNKSYDENVIAMLVDMGLTREAAIAKINKSLKSEDVNLMISELNKVIGHNLLGNELDILSSQLIEFDALKNPKSKITLETAIKSGIENDNIINENEVFLLLNKMGINNIQVSELVEIINYAYGYTRIFSNPLDDPRNNLALKAFPDYKVYTSKLNTEGLLIEIDRRKIFNWLIENGVVIDDYQLNDDELKVWFMENVHSGSINQFKDMSNDDLVTKYTYTLIHTISHLLIESSGLCSGLSKDSISEIIFPNICAIFIYSTTIQGITMGALSGMFESDVLNFLETAYSNYEICTLDPICTDNQDGACVACTYISDVACCHFNKDLSRILLYGKDSNYKNLKIKKGFWK